MKIKSIILIIGLCATGIVLSAQALKVTGGIELTKGNIQRDVLLEVIQQKQEEVFSRVFANLVIGHFQSANRDEGIFNMPTYFALYNIMTDLTVGKSKTTVSQSIISNAAELAYVYAFTRYIQDLKIDAVATKAAQNQMRKNGIDKSDLVDTVDVKGKVKPKKENLRTLNYYLDASFEVLARDTAVQSKFRFKRSLEGSEIKEWYSRMSPLNPNLNLNREFVDITGDTISFDTLVAQMKLNVGGFLRYTGSVQNIGLVGALEKNAIGFTKGISNANLNAIKLMLLEFATRSDYMFSQNVAKTLLRLIVENMHIELNSDTSLNQVYIDVEALILSIDKEFVTKSKKSSIASGAFFINPRPFLTIGTSSTFLLNSNTLGAVDDNGNATSLHNISLASEKIGFRIKVWDGGYTRSFGPGEAYKYHGTMRVWTQPQKKFMVSSVYYNAYASGLLYNLLDLKTNKNFDYGLFATNVGVIFFNGLELSAGYGWVYDKGFSADNSIIKIDFDIPIVDYITALRKKN